MRYAILSDIHGNLEALRAVLEACEDEGVRGYFCAGDIVGYGADPAACIETIRSIKAKTIAGNHDWAVVGKEDTRDFNPVARAAIEWTKEHLAQEEIDWLNQLELVYHHQDFVMVHGTLNRPELFTYMTDLGLANDTFYLMKKPLCFIGHTHEAQVIIQHEGKLSYLKKLRFELDARIKCIVNVGSVGQPRDGDPRASYCIYDPDLSRVEIKRAAYDIRSAQAKILEAGLPEFLAQRLGIGQ